MTIMVSITNKVAMATVMVIATAVRRQRQQQTGAFMSGMGGISEGECVREAGWLPCAALCNSTVSIMHLVIQMMAATAHI